MRTGSFNKNQRHQLAMGRALKSLAYWEVDHIKGHHQGGAQSDLCSCSG